MEGRGEGDGGGNGGGFLVRARLGGDTDDAASQTAAGVAGGLRVLEAAAAEVVVALVHDLRCARGR